jgi:hypothetical protein
VRLLNLVTEELPFHMEYRSTKPSITAIGFVSVVRALHGEGIHDVLEYEFRPSHSVYVHVIVCGSESVHIKSSLREQDDRTPRGFIPFLPELRASRKLLHFAYTPNWRKWWSRRL